LAEAELRLLDRPAAVRVDRHGDVWPADFSDGADAGDVGLGAEADFHLHARHAEREVPFDHGDRARYVVSPDDQFDADVIADLAAEELAVPSVRSV